MAHRAFTTVLFLVPLAIPAVAQWGRGGSQDIRPRFRTTDSSDESGWCKLRLRVDGEVVVAMQRDRIQVRVLSGQPASDEGSECSSPLPARGFTDFEFDKTDGRGRAWVEDPLGPDNGRIVLRVRDGDGGSDKYTLEFKWRHERGLAGNDRWSDRSRWARDARFDIRTACRQELRARLRNDFRASPGRQLEERIRPANGSHEELTGRVEALRDGETRIVEYRCTADPRNGRIVDFDQRFLDSSGSPRRR